MLTPTVTPLTLPVHRTLFTRDPHPMGHHYRHIILPRPVLLGNLCQTFSALIKVNANGIQKRWKKIALRRPLYDLEVGVCVVAETNLRKPEADRISFKNYNVIAEDCRDAQRKIGGGVLTLVHTSRNAEKLHPPLPARPPLEMRTIKFYPT